MHLLWKIKKTSYFVSKLWFLQMKTSLDPRHLERREAVKNLFADTFTPQKHFTRLAIAVKKNLKMINKQINNNAVSWPIDRVNKIDLAILRLSVYELTKTKTPPKVVIDEAVELAKEFGSENSSSFINGVLGTILEELK